MMNFRHPKNGIPAFAGMTLFYEHRSINKHRHPRVGGDPIILCNMR